MLSWHDLIPTKVSWPKATRTSFYSEGSQYEGKMPNLVGIWNLELSEQGIREILTKQLHRVRIPKISYDEYIAIHPGFGMGLQDHGILENGRQPVQTEDGRISLML